MLSREAVTKSPLPGRRERRKRATALPTSLGSLYEQLMMEGLLSAQGIPRRMDEFVPFNPIPAQGKAASEIIIENLRSG
jgi:hypothetical protein